MSSKNKILIAPLNWGLGHATRCIPIIKMLRIKGVDVQIASDGDALLLLKGEFPNLTHWELPSYKISYGSSFVWSMAKGLTNILKAVNEEKNTVAEIVAKEKITHIISDNRYGCHHPSTKNIFICHQQNLLMPKGMKFIESTINGLHKNFLKKFDTHWIPDTKEHDFAGKLSFTSFENSEFIGSLSRLEKMDIPTIYDVVAIISGPEPQRTFFFEKIKAQLIHSTLKSLIIGGKISQKADKNEIINNCTIAQFMNTIELNQTMAEAPVIVCRSGYSSIMDLAAMQKKAVLIPTPGQTEQIYLAERLHDLGIAFYEKQNNMNLSSAIENATKRSGFTTKKIDNQHLETALNNLL